MISFPGSRVADLRPCKKLPAVKKRAHAPLIMKIHTSNINKYIEQAGAEL
jgi:hypothetical protein